MEALRLDLRYALRALLANPGFSALAILTLAVGIGVNAVAFTAINALLYKPSRFAHAETLGWISSRSANADVPFSLPDYQDLVERSRSFESLIAAGRRPLSLQDRGTTRQVWAQFVTGNYLAVLDVRPRIGRLFTAADLAGPELPVLVSHRFWTRDLAGGSSVAGRTLTLNNRLVSIVGVVPDGFQGPTGLFEPDVWIQLDSLETLGLPSRLMQRTEPWLAVVGRVRDDVTSAQANADLKTVAASLRDDHPVTHKDRSFTFTPVLQGHPELRGIASVSWILLGIVGLVLLIACFNVAGLLLARASQRQREIGVRAALGASRTRIIRQFTLEGVLLAMASGALAIVVANWSADLLAVFSLPSPIPQRLHMQVDGRLIGFTAALAALGGVLPTLLPAFHATRVDLVRSMRMEASFGQPAHRSRNAFIVAQIAGSTLFLAAALFFIRGFWHTASTNPGFDTSRLVVAEMKPTTFGYDAPRARVFFDNLIERLRAHPGVAHAALSDRVPFYVGYPKLVKVSGRNVNVYAIGAGYFSALGVRLDAGREFTAQDAENSSVAIVSRSTAARLWPGRNAVGESLREDSGTVWQVVGVAADYTHRQFGEPVADHLYRPLRAAEYGDTVTTTIRTTGDANAFIGTAQAHVRALDPNLPADSIKTMERRMEMPLWPLRTAAGFFLVCGTLALVLAMVGLFGMTYLAVSQRMREFGIRAALGATRARVMRLVIGEGVWMALPGIALGLVGAAIAGRVFIHGSALFRLTPNDPIVYIAAAVLQALVALAACALPAHRATKADPMRALRID